MRFWKQDIFSGNGRVRKKKSLFFCTLKKFVIINVAYKPNESYNNINYILICCYNLSVSTNTVFNKLHLDKCVYIHGLYYIRKTISKEIGIEV